jgi:hypothetical protein
MIEKEIVWKSNYEKLSKKIAGKVFIKSNMLPFKTSFRKRSVEDKKYKEIEVFTFKTERKDVKFIEMPKKKTIKLDRPPTVLLTKEEEDFLKKEDPENLKKNMRKIKGASKLKN